MATKYKTLADDMIDAVCFKHYGAVGHYLEAVYQANPTLCTYPIKLPAGLLITLPDIHQEAERSLW